MSENAETVEDYAAGILNGVMICLLGAAFPVIFLWQVGSHWSSGTLDFGRDSWADIGPFVGLIVFSLLFLRTGARLVRKNVTALRLRSNASPPG